MSAQVRVLRQRVKSVKSTQKITKAQEMIATSRIAKAQAAVDSATPYSDEITEVITALASHHSAELKLPILEGHAEPKRAAVLMLSADRGLCGGYNANVIKANRQLRKLLEEQGKQRSLYILGRKGLGYYTFRQKDVAGSWTGHSERPRYSDAVEIANELLPLFRLGSGNFDDAGREGVDEVHIVYTEFVSMLSQQPKVVRLAPLEVEYVEQGADSSHSLLPTYLYEPDPTTLLTSLLPRYVTTRIYAAMLEAAASESAARRQACQSATDNAADIIKTLSRQMNQARQAQITQELTEIIGGADALAAAGAEED